MSSWHNLTTDRTISETAVIDDSMQSKMFDGALDVLFPLPANRLTAAAAPAPVLVQPVKAASIWKDALDCLFPLSVRRAGS